MKFQKLLDKVGLQIKLTGLAFLLPLGIMPAYPSTTVLPSLPRPIKDASLENHQRNYLIARSTQLQSLFSNSVFDNSYRTVKRLNYTHANYSDAWNNGWRWYVYIVDKNSIVYAGWTSNTGHIYRANLLGGGTANYRERGSSGPYPTIDLKNHYSYFPDEKVNEVKFKY